MNVKRFLMSLTLVVVLCFLYSKKASGARQVVYVDFAEGVHAWTTKNVDCPPGHVVSGMQVVFGGTCKNNCNKDGAVIRSIKLACTPAFD